METTKLDMLRETVRAPFSYGGYAQHLLLDDGGVCCHRCASEEYRAIYRSTRDDDQDGWGVSGVFVHWEGPPSFCEVGSHSFDAEYGDPWASQPMESALETLTDSRSEAIQADNAICDDFGVDDLDQAWRKSTGEIHDYTNVAAWVVAQHYRLQTN